jgi:hypothetical protein
MTLKFLNDFSDSEHKTIAAEATTELTNMSVKGLSYYFPHFSVWICCTPVEP